MNLFGLKIARKTTFERAMEKAAEQAVHKALSSPGGTWGGGWSVIHDFQQGAFEQGLPPLNNTQMNSQACVYACRTLIANSIAKLPIHKIQLLDGAWQKVPSDYELLSRPSKIANRITWVSYLVHSMLGAGAGFGFKHWQDGKLRYIELLHPSTEVLVSEMGEVFYRLNSNIYSHLPEAQRTVPGEYIFHVPYNTLVHPLVGVPPIEAAKAAALSGSAVMSKQARSHANRPEVYGFLKVPVTLTDAQANAAKDAWKSSNGRDGSGVAVLRNGVDFEPLQMTAKEAESAAALNLANEDIARAFGVPKHLLGIGTIPSAANAEALMLGFYSQTLQPIAELIELALDEAMELPANVGVEFDVSALSRLDTKGRYEALRSATGGAALLSVNEGRAREGLPPVEGGEKPLVQMQDVPIGTAATDEPKPDAERDDDGDDDELEKRCAALTKRLDEAVFYRGLYMADEEYRPGDLVSYRGTAWVAAETTRSAPRTSVSGRLKSPWTKITELEPAPAEEPVEKRVEALETRLAAALFYRGAYRANVVHYDVGSIVSDDDGKLWVSKSATPGKPGEEGSGWTTLMSLEG